jgi:hypothetical protein
MQRGMIAAVGLKNPLHDDFAALVLEIDIDIGRLAAFFRDEPLEQKIITPGIDGSDAKDIADGGISGRAAALAQNVLAASEADDGIHGQKVGRIFEIFDQLQLVLDATTWSSTPSG